MDAMLGRYLTDRLLFAQHLLHDLGLELRGILRRLLTHPLILPPPSLRPRGPNSWDHYTYDNLTSAVKAVLVGRGRVQQEAFVALRGHYVFEVRTSRGWRGRTRRD